LTVASGAIVVGGSNTSNSIFGGGAFVLPGASGSFTGETFVWQNGPGSSTRVDVPLIGGGTLVVGGSGSFNFNQSAGTSYTGGTFINSGANIFLSNSNGILGAGPVTLTGGAVNPNTGGQIALANPVSLN